jgi:DNA-binding transcriptional LysR family regulator
MIQEGYDAGVIVGDITDERVIARPAGKVARYLAAAPALLEKHPAAREPADLKSWPWLALSGEQFGGSKKVVLSAPKRGQQTIDIAPLLTSEGVTSLREATLAGIGVSVLADWLVREDLVAGRLVRVLPQWNARELSVNVVYPGQRHLPARVRMFVEHAVAYMTTEMHVSSKAGGDALMKNLLKARNLVG